MATRIDINFKPWMKITVLFLQIILGLVILSCKDEEKVVEEDIKPKPVIYDIPYYNAPSHYPGIPLMTCDMSKSRLTEINSDYVVRSSSSVSTSIEILRNGYNSLLKINYENVIQASDYIEFAVSCYGRIVDDIPMPDEMADQIEGISFRAVSFDAPVELVLKAIDINGNVINSASYTVKQDSIRQYSLSFDGNNLGELSFFINADEQSVELPLEGAIGIDDIYFLTGTQQAFTPPTDDDGLLTWLKESSIRYFIWNYSQVDGTRGVVSELASNRNKVSLSGMGYAFPAFIMAQNDGMLTSTESENRVLALLKWLQNQNWFDGSGGWRGFPHHYFNQDGTKLYNDVSTIDWAICAAGIRVARQFYSSNTEIVNIATELLGRAKWDSIIGDDGRIAMGLDANGNINDYRWGLAFSEETELVYLEAIASGKVGNEILDEVVREKKQGFYPSWYGSGFTYNWLQLWTGPIEPYATNSQIAFEKDASTCLSVFGKALIGLTACTSLSGVDGNGFIKWNNYYGNQGSNVSGASFNEVIQISPAPYGACLALPFYNNSLNAIREYIEIGFYHPLLGLPDNIRLARLPTGIAPVPYWNTFDINIGPIAMAIESTEDNIIGSYYRSDAAIEAALNQIISSFTF